MGILEESGARTGGAVERVSVNKGILIGIVTVAAASLLGVAFLLGRLSGSASPAAPASGRALARGPVASPPPMPAPADVPIAEAVDAPTPAPEASTPGPIVLPPVAEATLAPAIAGEPRGTPPDPARAAVAAYLDAVDNIQPGKMSGSAEGVANEMAAALAKGDTSGLDKIIRETEAAKASLAALTPPAACAAHHRESLASVDEALEVLRSLRTAMQSPDPAAQLAGVAARATALRSRAEAVEKEEQALRKRYGLTR